MAQLYFTQSFRNHSAERFLDGPGELAESSEGYLACCCAILKVPSSLCRNFPKSKQYREDCGERFSGGGFFLSRWARRILSTILPRWSNTCRAARLRQSSVTANSCCCGCPRCMESLALLQMEMRRRLRCSCIWE